MSHFFWAVKHLRLLLWLGHHWLAIVGGLALAAVLVAGFVFRHRLKMPRMPAMPAFAKDPANTRKALIGLGALAGLALVVWLIRWTGYPTIVLGFVVAGLIVGYLHLTSTGQSLSRWKKVGGWVACVAVIALGILLSGSGNTPSSKSKKPAPVVAKQAPKTPRSVAQTPETTQPIDTAAHPQQRVATAPAVPQTAKTYSTKTGLPIRVVNFEDGIVLGAQVGEPVGVLIPAGTPTCEFVMEHGKVLPKDVGRQRYRGDSLYIMASQSWLRWYEVPPGSDKPVVLKILKSG